MANLNKTDFIAKWTALFANNTTRAITEAKMREYATDTKDSFANLTDNPLPDEATQAVVQNEATTEATTYVSPRRFWQGITRALALSWTWAEKQIYSKGVSLGNNASPAANGDFWADGTDLFSRLGGVNYRVPTAKNKVGRVLFVSKDGNDTTAIIGSQSFSYLTIQAAVTASTSGDTFVIYAGTYTENIALGGNIPDRTFIFINATLSGTISNTIFNGCNYGRIIGVGNSVITGAITISGTSSTFESIENITLNTLSVFSNFYKNCTFTVATEGFMGGTYENCTFTSVGTNLITQYGASGGFKLFNCRITCNNFTTSIGGINGAFVGDYVIQGCAITCINFFSNRATSVVLQITDSTIKASGTSYFFGSDIAAAYKVQVVNTVLQTACTNLDQTTLNANSIISAIANKAVSGSYLTAPTVISSLSLI